MNNRFESPRRKIGRGKHPIRSAVKRERAEDYLLTSLVGFGVTVVAVRLFLDLAGYPQVGNSVLHIAHALWGALLLFVAVILPLVFVNRWAIQFAALLSGVGIGLFIDEVGKFITQKNDYFFPPALPLIYGFFLLVLFVYFYLRRSKKENARHAIYHAIEGLEDILDGDLDLEEAARIEEQLAIAGRSDNDTLRRLARTLEQYLEEERQHLSAARPGYGDRVTDFVRGVGLRFGRTRHRWLISALLTFWTAFAVLGGVILALLAIRGDEILDEDVRRYFNSSTLSIIESRFWVSLTAFLQVSLALLAFTATVNWLLHRESVGHKYATLGLTFSLVLMQPMLFYTNQLSALSGTLQQFFFLLLLLAYGRWYLQQPLSDEDGSARPDELNPAAP